MRQTAQLGRIDAILAPGRDRYNATASALNSTRATHGESSVGACAPEFAWSRPVR